VDDEGKSVVMEYRSDDESVDASESDCDGDVSDESVDISEGIYRYIIWVDSHAKYNLNFITVNNIH
jgi:hypothetical protein